MCKNCSSRQYIIILYCPTAVTVSSTSNTTFRGFLVVSQQAHVEGFNGNLPSHFVGEFIDEGAASWKSVPCGESNVRSEASVFA